MSLSRNIPLFWLLTLLPSLALCADYGGLSSSQWVEARSDNFILVTDTSPDKARYIVQDLENYRHFLTQQLNLQVIEGLPPLPVLAVDRGANFRKLGLPNQFSGIFLTRIYSHAAIANVDNYKPKSGSSSFGRQTLLHEYFHYLMQSTTDSLVFPAWFEEGMAEYWATFKYTDTQVSVGYPGAINARAFSLDFRGGKFGPLYIEDLFNTKHLVVGTDNMNELRETSRLYARAFYTVHYLNSTSVLESSMYRYVSLINQGVSTDNALQAAFGKDYDSFDRDVQSYLNRNGNLMIRNFPLKKGEFTFPTPNIDVQPLSEGDFYRHLANIVWSLNLKSMPKEERIALLDRAIALNPADPALKVHRYRLAEHRARWSELAKDLLEHHPQSAHARALMGEGLAYEAKLQRASDVGDWESSLKLARGHFRASAKLDPYYGAGYAGLGNVYDHLDQNEPLHEGIIGYDSASVYERNPTFFLDQAQLAIKMEQPLGAITPLRKFFAFKKHEDYPGTYAKLEGLELYNLTGQATPRYEDEHWIYPDGSRYTGETRKQKPHGKGKLTAPNGSVFEGTFVEGLIEGPGRLTTRTRTHLEGHFHQGLARGETFFSSPSPKGNYRYEGTVRHGEPHGKGVEHYRDGTQYEGHFFQGYRHGKGQLTQGEQTLAGEWRYGDYVWELDDGLTFIGWYTDDGSKPDGSGVCHKQEGNLLEHCEFKNGERVN